MDRSHGYRNAGDIGQRNGFPANDFMAVGMTLLFVAPNAVRLDINKASTDGGKNRPARSAPLYL